MSEPLTDNPLIIAPSPEPTDDVATLTEVVRALRQTIQSLGEKAQQWDMAIEELKLGGVSAEEEGLVITLDQPTQRLPNGRQFDDPNLDLVFTRAVEKADRLVTDIRAEFYNILENYKAGREDLDALIKAEIDSLDVRINEDVAELVSEKAVRLSATRALAGSIERVSTKLGLNETEIRNEKIVRSTQYDALSVQISSVSAAVADNAANITSIQTAFVDADLALASDITTVAANLAETNAGGFYRLVALASPTDGAAAEFRVEVKATEGGPFATTGMTIQAFSSGERRVKFNTDKFIITDGATSLTPFAIAGGVVYIEDLVVQRSNIETGAVTEVDGVENVAGATAVLGSYGTLTAYATIPNFEVTGEGAVWVHCDWQGLNAKNTALWNSNYDPDVTADYTENGQQWTTNTVATGQDCKFTATHDGTGVSTDSSETTGFTLWVGGATSMSSSAIFTGLAAGTYTLRFRLKTTSGLIAENGVRNVRFHAMEFRR